MADANANPENGQEFAIHRLFVTDLSFEAPDSPAVFKEEWKPEVDLNLDNTSEHLEGDLHNVTLKVTVTTKINDKTVFIAEVSQGGIFMIKGFNEQQQDELLGAFCPNVLFPYVRECVSDLVNRGGFPPLYLSPVNFDAIYQQKKAQTKH